MSSPALYIAAPYLRARYVEDVVVPMALEEGLRIASLWHRTALGPEQLTPEIAAVMLAQNDADLRRASLVFALGCFIGEGREMWAEVARANEWSKPVIYVGPDYLSAHRERVTWCRTIDEGLAALRAWARAQGDEIARLRRAEVT